MSIFKLILSTFLLAGLNASATAQDSSADSDVFNAKKFIKQMMKKRRSNMYKKGQLVENPGPGPYMLNAKLGSVKKISEHNVFTKEGQFATGFAPRGGGLDLEITNLSTDKVHETDYKRGRVRIHTQLLGEAAERDLKECRYVADGALESAQGMFKVEAKSLKRHMLFRKPLALIVINRKIRRNMKVTMMIDEKVAEVQAKIDDLSDSTDGTGGQIVLTAIAQLEALKDSLLAEVGGINNYMAKLRAAKRYVLANGLFQVRRRPRVRLMADTTIKCNDYAQVLY